MSAKSKPKNGGSRSDRPGEVDPQWYKDAVIYEVRTRSFYDSNGDGIGDLAGLTEKLDYLQDLGVTCLWLLPLCVSPGRDDGYDIADYMDVHPDVGTIAEFQRFVDEAHRRDLRIVTELVFNHTSDQHAWFQRARRAPPGSVERDFYVWSDTPHRYQEARIIFKDFEPSNWTWDSVANAYFWHRFFSHQPDLNFENQAVHDALFEVVDFWFGMGVDGVRLDAVPYLYEAEGTNCENLPQTHEFLKKLRRHIDSKFSARMLLAEANQWPEDAAAYFGDGDECHMNFHFPIMPRMFMAIHMEDRFPIIDILEQTPQLHPTCQWAMFLRNHDELTLEMVTDEERDYMYRAYAHDAAMRINLGIRRRLAPLVGNDRRKMELLNGLLFSLPGTPVLYYGDEMGMGDNIYLGDRNGVRTPMQWNTDRNAGFSRANPQRLILPIVIDPEYHYESLNVEAQQNNPNSLLWWTKRLIALRKRFFAFGRGTIDFLSPSNSRVLAFFREFGEENILVVANLSRFVQYVELDLSRCRGMVPVELFGRTKFPAVGDNPYMLSLGGYDFYWFSLERTKADVHEVRMSLYDIPELESATLEDMFEGETEALEEVLLGFLETRRWYGGRGRIISSCQVTERVVLQDGRVGIVFLRIEYSEGDPETYVFPVAIWSDALGTDVRVPHQAVIASMRGTAAPGGARTVLVDALELAHRSQALVEAIVGHERKRGRFGEVSASFADEVTVIDDPRPMIVDSLNATIRFGDRWVLKFFRRLEEGVSPEIEVGRFIGARASQLVPRVAGHLEYRSGRSERTTLAVLQHFIQNEGTMWTHAREELRRYYERALTKGREIPVPAAPTRPLLEIAFENPPVEVAELIGAYKDVGALLGKRTAELHLALAAAPEDPAFAPEPFSSFDRRSVYQSLRNLTGHVMRTLRAELPLVPAQQAETVRAIAGREGELLKRYEPLLSRKLTSLRVRCHGDYHLDQVLNTGKDVVIIDFEGDRSRALAERRRKRTPLRDVASMVHSFHHAAFTTLHDTTAVREADRASVLPWAIQWYTWVSAGFMRAYLEHTAAASFLRADIEEVALLLDVFMLSKALHDLDLELKKSDRRLDIELQELAQLLRIPTP
ncbi:MAG TPA: maltose alpha-D-glucosyltransferase [Polyangiaceae bacterium]|nr:maltose alpha-D-glucosyltransferase [Polyangiaceae bacterium]